MESDVGHPMRYRYPVYCRSCGPNGHKHHTDPTPLRREGRIEQDNAIIHWALPDIHAKTSAAPRAPKPRPRAPPTSPVETERPRIIAPIILSAEHTFIPQDRMDRYIEEYLNIPDKNVPESLRRSTNARQRKESYRRTSYPSDLPVPRMPMLIDRQAREKRKRRIKTIHLDLELDDGEESK